MSIGWAIISAGDYADTRGAPAINQAQGAELVAVSSRDQGRADAFAQKHGAKTAYASVEDVLSDSRVDAVYITAPNHLHAPYTKMAANAGKHVLVEKPMSLTVSEGLEMVQVCRERGVKLGVGFHLRHHPGHMEGQRLVADGALGTIALAQALLGYGVRGEVRPEPRAGLRDWWTHPEMVGGAFATIALGVHCIDDLHFILGQRVVEIAAITDGHTAERPLEDLATMCLRFDQGTIGTISCGLRLPESQNDVAIYGSHGKVVLSGASWPRLEGELRVSSETVNTNAAYERDAVVLVARKIEDFGRAMAQGRDPAASGTDGLRAVQVTAGMVESAKTGRTVKLDPLPV